jgi:hypothetical protein
MQDAELAERRKRCYDLVVQLDELEGRQNEQEEHLQRVKRQRTHLHEEFEHEKRSFVEEWTKANAGRDDGAASRDEEAARAEREWNDWVNKAKQLHGSSALSATSDSHDIAAAPSSSDDAMAAAVAAEAAVVETIEGDGIPVPQLQERVPAAEPPRLRSTRRSRRSFSLTSPTAPSTPVRKRLEWDAAHNADSTDGSAELMPSPGSGLPSSASSSPATSSPATTTVGEDSSASTAAMCKLPTPVRGRSTSPTAAAAAAAAGDQPTPAAAVAVAAPSRKELIDELLNPPSSSSEAAPPSPTPQIVVSTPSSSQNSARVLFEE